MPRRRNTFGPGAPVEQDNGNDKLPCGHSAEQAWHVTNADLLHPVLAQFKPSYKFGVRLIQCQECKLIVNLQLTATPLKPQRIVTPQLMRQQ